MIFLFFHHFVDLVGLYVYVIVLPASSGWKVYAFMYHKITAVFFYVSRSGPVLIASDSLQRHLRAPGRLLR